MQRHYETIFIVDPDITEDTKKALVKKASDIVDGDGADLKVDDWGRRSLAYPINKKHDGIYFLMTYTTDVDSSKELERILRLNEDCVRYQTVRLNERIEEAPVEAPVEAPAPVEAAPAAAPATEGGSNE